MDERREDLWSDGSWVIMLMVLRLLAPEDYGLMAISTVIIVIVASVADLGMGASAHPGPDARAG